MKSKLTIGLLMISISLMLNCSNNDSKYATLDEAIAKVMVNSDISNQKHFVIIPKAGCTGCIEGATLYVKNNIEKMNNIQIIFTGIGDLKLLKMQLGSSLIKRPNVHIDSENLFRNVNLQSDYPQLLTLKNGEVVNLEELDTSDPKALKSLAE